MLFIYIHVENENLVVVPNNKFGNFTFFQLPTNGEEWRKVAKGFEVKWQFPNCLGAVDGKHVRIIAQKGSGSLFWNYKKFHSIVLMAIVNSNYEFMMCDVGTNGSISDGGVIANTILYKKLIEDDLKIPADESPLSSGSKLPHVFVGDEAFALRHNFLKPFNKKQLNYERMVYNYRLSRARRVVENAFGILSNRFRIFHSAINLQIETVEQVVMTCCYLHNFLRRHLGPTYDVPELNESGIESVECQGLVDLQVGSYKNIATEAKISRNKYVEYFVGEGRVDWQDEVVRTKYM